MSTKRKLQPKLGQPTVKQSAKVLAKDVLDESRTVVTSGHDLPGMQSKPAQNVNNISGDASSGEYDSDEASMTEKPIPASQITVGDAKLLTENTTLESTENHTEPSFGDLVRANVSETIDVAGAFDTFSSGVKNYPLTTIQTPSGASLGAVLAQALRTNDIALLETCLHTSDINTIRATIQRLESSFAAKLLQKLAERLHKRPGIAGNLMVWVQWTLVAHGGYLASQRGLVQSLAELTKVIDERSRGLQSVLSLKGKLDMLEAQIEMRRSIQGNRRRLEDEEDDETIIYVEGQEKDDRNIKDVQKHSVNGNLEEIMDDKSDISEEMPTTNGLVAESDDEEDYSSNDDSLIDDEAEETNSDLTDEEDDVFYDEDSIDDGEDSDGAPPSKIARARGDSSKKKLT